MCLYFDLNLKIYKKNIGIKYFFLQFIFKISVATEEGIRFKAVLTPASKESNSWLRVSNCYFPFIPYNP